MATTNLHKNYSNCCDFRYNVADRKKVCFKMTVQISCSNDKLWSLLKEPGHLAKTHPFCKTHKADFWGIKGASDEVMFYNGNTIVRTIDEIDDFFYVLKLVQNENKSNNLTVRVEAKSLSKKSCSLTFKIELDSFRKIPRPIWWLYYRKRLARKYELYLGSVVKGYKFYLEEEKPVVKNQFGFHKDYSTP